MVLKRQPYILAIIIQQCSILATALQHCIDLESTSAVTRLYYYNQYKIIMSNRTLSFVEAVGSDRDSGSGIESQFLSTVIDYI